MNLQDQKICNIAGPLRLIPWAICVRANWENEYEYLYAEYKAFPNIQRLLDNVISYMRSITVAQVLIENREFKLAWVIDYLISGKSSYTYRINSYKDCEFIRNIRKIIAAAYVKKGVK